ncbi:MAG TPA: hypothetical protein VLI69_01185 [Gammaproteobacteria bacterium]|nr:hypothetical protein [Gammaproteobacteria bacterium]
MLRNSCDDLADPLVPEESSSPVSSPSAAISPRLKTDEELFVDDEKRAKSKIKFLCGAIIIGAFRDAVWSWQVVKQHDFFDEKLGAFFSPTLTQTGGAIVSVIVAGHFNLRVINHDLLFDLNRREWRKRLGVLCLASGSTVPVWNAAEYAGIYLGAQLSFNSLNANYFAGIFTGITETLWQNAFIIPILLRLPLDPLEITLNVLAGAVWKWVITACLDSFAEESGGDFKTAASVALSVAFTTLQMTLLAWLIKRCCRNRQEDMADDCNRLFSPRLRQVSINAEEAKGDVDSKLRLGSRPI